MKIWWYFVVISLAAACGPDEKADAENNGIIVINNDGSNNDTANNDTSNNNNATSNNGPGGGGTNVATNNTPEPGTTAADVKAGLTAPSVAHDLGEGLLSLGAAAVFEASIQANGGTALVTTGTLTQQGQAFTYSATPNDRLRVAWSDGAPTDFWVTAFVGNFDGDANYFVTHDHTVELRAARDGVADVSVSSQRMSGSTSASLAGSFTLDGVEYEVNASETGTYSASADFGTAEYESQTRFTGSITGSNGFSQTLDESFRFKLLNEVTNSDREAASTWTAGGKQYTLEGFRVRWEELSGNANPTDYWIAQGDVYEDGTLIGQVSYETNTLWISIFVQIGAEKIELYRFTLRQQQ